MFPKMFKKSSEKLKQNFLPLDTWLLHGKTVPVSMTLFKSFLTASKPSRRSITAAIGKKRRKRKGEKILQKSKSPKMFQILISAHARTKMSENAMLVERHLSPGLNASIV